MIRLFFVLIKAKNTGGYKKAKVFNYFHLICTMPLSCISKKEPKTCITRKVYTFLVVNRLYYLILLYSISIGSFASMYVCVKVSNLVITDS